MKPTCSTTGGAPATAGTPEKFNTCTISWGSLGSIWGNAGKAKPIVTIYIHLTRYTNEFLRSNELFTVSFFPEEHRKDLAILGKLSGRDCDKVAKTSLTPEFTDGTVTFKEATTVLVCRRLYHAPMLKENIDPEIVSEIYPDRDAHDIFIGEIMKIIDRK
ncbi:MAG: flavin reductase [Succinivibrionaceae bacterium]|nr:flavin reductase [Succinivibrionaceae bacterium]